MARLANSGVPAGVALDSARSEATVTIVDDEYTVSINTPNPSIVFEGSPIKLIGTLSRALTRDIELGIEYLDLTTNDRDFASRPVTVTVPAKRTYFVVHIPTVDDVDAESNELVRITVVPPDVPDGESAPGANEVIIQENDILTIPRNLTTVAGEAVRVPVQFSRSTRGGRTMVVGVTATQESGAGKATENVDYQAGRYVITIPVGSGYGWVDIPTTGDGDTAAETFKLEFDITNELGTQDYDQLSGEDAIVTILPSSSPVPAIAIEAGQAEVAAGGTASFTVTANPTPPENLMVGLRVWSRGGRFLSDADNGAYHTVVVDAADGQGTLSVSTVDDPSNVSGVIAAALLDRNLSEAGRGSYPYRVPNNRMAIVRVAVGTSGTSGQIEATPPELTISADADSVTEGGDVTFTVTADAAPGIDIAVNLGTSEEMGEGLNFVGVGQTGTVTIPADETSATWTVTTYSDDVERADGTVVGRIKPSQDYRLGEPSSVTLALLDNDGTGGGTADSVRAPVATGPPAGVPMALIAEVRRHIADFKARNHPAGIRDWTLIHDRLEGRTGMSDEAIAAWLARSRLYGWQDGIVTLPKVQAALAALEAAPEPQQQPVTLPEVSVAAGASPVTEGGDAVFTFTATPTPASPLAVSVNVAAGGDYGIDGGSRTVTIPPTGSFTLTLATTGDTTDEPDGSVTVTVNDGAGYTVGASASGSVAIRDDDEPLPEVTVVAGGSPVTEGGDAVFTLTASPLPASPLAVSVSVAADGDYGITGGSRTVTIPPTGSFTLTLTTADDTADEPDGSLTVTVTDGAGYTVGASASGTVSIEDDDLPPPVVSITADAASVTEGGAAAVTVSADRAPKADLTITLSVAEAEGSDHVAADDEGSRSVTIAKGETQAAFSVATVDDTVDEPNGSVTVTVATGDGYTVSSSQGAATVAVADNDAAVGPGLSVADATVTEGDQASLMEFAVRLSAPAAKRVQVRASTRVSTPVSARPKEDYWPLRGFSVNFRPGETEKTVWVYIYNDSHDEDPETFEVVLSDADGAAIGDGVAVGTIVNNDPMPAAWLARFGRTVAQQALDGIAGRLAAPRTPGAQGTLAGQPFTLRSQGGDDTAPDAPAPGTPLLAGLAAQMLPTLTTHGGPGAGPPAGFDPGAPGQAGGGGPAGRTLTLRDVLLGSSFTATGQPDAHGGSMAFWGRAAQATFEGREGTFALDGETTTAMLGTDYAQDRWLLGVTLLQSLGTGGYDDRDATDAETCANLPAALRAVLPAELCNGAVREGAGSVESTLTAAVPYAAFQASERLKLWGAAGYGVGEVTLAPETGGTLKTDIAWTMAELGLRGTVLAPPPAGTGPTLAVTSDALWARTTSEQVQNGLAASNSAVTRLRLGLEGQWAVVLETLGQLTPTLAVGARHDGGDAETGFGVELGGGLAWHAPRVGLALNLEGRTLLTHRDEAFKDQGVAAAFTFDPDPTTPRGPSLTVRQDWGGQATGGVDALFAADPLTQRPGTTATQSRWAAEAAWGFPAFGGHFTGSPHVGVGLAPGTRDYRLGWRLVPATPASTLSLDLQATRRELDAAQPEHTVGLELSTRW